MTWPVWFVVGLVLIAALVTVAYVVWLSSIAGYTEVKIPNEEFSPLAEVLLCDERTGEEELIGYVVAYRNAEPQSPWQLDEKLESKVASERKGKLEHMTVIKEPGYNSFRIYHKNKEMLKDAYKAWSNSAFHAIIMPLELLLRASLFPLWTMIDFVSHERRVAAGLVLFPDVYLSPDAMSQIKASVSVVEAYNTLYTRMTDCGSIRFKKIEGTSSRSAMSFERESKEHHSDGTELMDWLPSTTDPLPSTTGLLTSMDRSDLEPRIVNDETS
jgi:hypothetical protein